MNQDEINEFGDTNLGTCIGIAIVVLALCLGIGSCNAIQAVASHHDEETEEVSQDAKAQTEAIAEGFMSTISVEAE